ncbi:MAG: TlpA disulfide reductase family protein [Gammaproteobacteria bacterium]|nr:TlpA disulfide reductase family protein [Gammaproteobacteria bacterium]
MLNKKYLQLILLGLLLAVTPAGLMAQDLPPLTHKLTELKDPVAAPALHLPNLDDEMVDLQDLRGRVVLVNFWATWCPPCRREMASMEQLYQAAQPYGLEILAVNIGEDEDTVFSFLGTVEPSPTFPMLLDSDGGSMATWKVRGLPTTYIVDPEGRLAYRAVGGREFDHPEIQRQLRELSR